MSAKLTQCAKVIIVMGDNESGAFTIAPVDHAWWDELRKWVSRMDLSADLDVLFNYCGELELEIAYTIDVIRARWAELPAPARPVPPATAAYRPRASDPSP